MFKWKFKRDPTPVEEQAITPEQAKQWFIDRHTVKRPWPLADDPPRDVKVIQPPIKQFCFNLNSIPSALTGQTYTGEWKLTGSIEFANGIKCKLETEIFAKKSYDVANSPHRLKMKIRKPCPACL